MVTVFEIPKREYPAFVEREKSLRLIDVGVQSLDGKESWDAIMCAEYSDKEFRENIFKDEKEYFNEVGQYYNGKIWRDDILPCRAYLFHCIRSAKNISAEFYDNFLDHTYLADKTTTIREYMSSRPGLFDDGVECSFSRYAE